MFGKRGLGTAVVGRILICVGHDGIVRGRIERRMKSSGVSGTGTVFVFRWVHRLSRGLMGPFGGNDVAWDRCRSGVRIGGRRCEGSKELESI